jgi:S-disulfanyl-L-cysteine oxidoreductase SoxD
MRSPLIVGATLCAALLSAPLCAQTVLDGASVLDGVYSNAQAQRGARTYANICSKCHEGGEPDADPLFGPEFIDRWREAPLSFLHGFFSKNMPAKDPGSLTPAVYIDTLAFLLRENGYPAGTELKADMLDTTLLVGAGGPQPLPPSALVKVSGCLRVDGDAARLEQASSFARVRRADDATPEELAASAAQPAGSAEVLLRNAGDFEAAALAGKQVLAKGVLSAQGTPSTLSVLSLAGTGGGC